MEEFAYEEESCQPENFQVLNMSKLAFIKVLRMAKPYIKSKHFVFLGKYIHKVSKYLLKLLIKVDYRICHS